MNTQDIPVGFRGFVYAPGNENYEVVMLFAMVLPYLDPPMCIKEASARFPDCIAIRWEKDGPREVRIELEKTASCFREHGHDIEGCDIIVCWENDWPDCPLEVIELKRELERIPFPLVLRPGEYLYNRVQGNARTYFDAVSKKSSQSVGQDQSEFFRYLDRLPGIHAKPGKWKKDETYTINSATFSLGSVQADGSVWLYFYGDQHRDRALPEDLREEYRRKAEGLLQVDTHGKPWKKVGKIGQKLEVERLKELMKWISERISDREAERS